ncbi:MAG: response regulator [Coriobacteriales bacterium]
MARERILIVDDDEHILKALDMFFSHQGVEAVGCPNGEAACDLLSRQRFDVVLLDLDLPDIDGFRVLERMRSGGDLTPVIVVSGHDEEYNKLTGLGAGADDYVTKPFSMPLLLSKIRALIRRTSAYDARTPTPPASPQRPLEAGAGAGEVVAGPGVRTEAGARVGAGVRVDVSAPAVSGAPAAPGTRVAATDARADTPPGRAAPGVNGGETMLTRGPFVLDRRTYQLSKGGRAISLTAQELRLMTFFMERPGRVFTKAQIYEAVWSNPVVDDNAVMVYVKRLRDKIEDDASHPTFITTVRGIGYSFSA